MNNQVISIQKLLKKLKLLNKNFYTYFRLRSPVQREACDFWTTFFQTENFVDNNIICLVKDITTSGLLTWQLSVVCCAHCQHKKKTVLCQHKKKSFFPKTSWQSTCRTVSCIKHVSQSAHVRIKAFLTYCFSNCPTEACDNEKLVCNPYAQML